MFSTAPPAPELRTNPDYWLNSKNLTLDQLPDKIILLHFWSYAHLHSLKSLPYIQKLWQTYQDKSFVLISIHSPQLEFEKDLDNLKKYVSKHYLAYPIVHDIDNINIKNYSCYSLPAFILINSKREIILQHTGEADFEEIEQTLLQELKLKGEIKKISPQITQEHHFYSPEISPLTSAGSHGNPAGLGSHLNKTSQGEEYTDSARHHLHTIYLQGPWTQKKEYLEFLGKSFGYITYPYYAKEVHISLGGLGIAEIFYNDQPLTKDLAGKDIIFKDARSFINIEFPGLYNILKSSQEHTAEIKLIPFPGLKVYELIFG